MQSPRARSRCIAAKHEAQCYIRPQYCFNATSLNDKLLHGHDLTNSVMSVLLQFRQFPVGIVGDIKAMFSKILVDAEDRDALWFLWFKDGDFNQLRETYRMKTQVFGVKLPPCCAAYALRRRASDSVTRADSDTVNAVRRNIYVDDLCLSCPTEQEGVRLPCQLGRLLASGGFRLTKINLCLTTN